VSRTVFRLEFVFAGALGVLGGGCSLTSLDSLSDGSGTLASNPHATSVAASSGSGAPTSSSLAGGGSPDAGGTGGAGGGGAAPSGSGGAGGDGGDATTGTGGMGGAGAGGATVVSECQSTGLLDDFDRVDGGLGLLWFGSSAFQIVNERVVNVPTETGYQWTVFSETFGPDQEAHVTLSQVNTAGLEQLIIMKVQGDANLEVLYSPADAAIQIWSCTPSCQLQAQEPAVVRDGARLAARATADGVVKACLDDVLVLEADVTDWAPYEGGGQIGIGTVRASSADPVFAFDDFGGGDARQPL